jgi:hypothetical protein
VLDVPTAKLVQDDKPGTVLSAAKPMTLVCGPVTFPGGAPLTADNATTAAFLLYREGAGGTRAIWDELGKRWVPDTTPPAPQPLMFADPVWQAILLAAGVKDVASARKLEPAGPSGQPRYFARCVFSGTDAAKQGHDGASPPTQVVQLVAPGGDDRVGVKIDPDPKEATEVRLFLTDAGLVERGSVAIRAAGGGFEVELTAAGARARLAADGSIELTPLAGRPVKVTGTLDVTGAITVNGTQLAVP